MDAYKKILVPIDDSEQSYDALKEAVNIAQRNGAHLFILTVTDMSMAMADARLMEYVREAAKEREKETLESIEQYMPKGFNYTTRKIEGTPKVSIVNFAKDTGIDLIVMGATGKGALERVLIGSTTSYVVTHAKCNVMIVR